MGNNSKYFTVLLAIVGVMAAATLLAFSEDRGAGWQIHSQSFVESRCISPFAHSIVMATGPTAATCRSIAFADSHCPCSLHLVRPNSSTSPMPAA